MAGRPDRAGRALDGRAGHARRRARWPPSVEQPWTDLVTDVVTLGTPHLGAPIARGIGHGSRGLGRLPETAAFGRILDWRSVGVHDLVAGLAEDVPPLPHARYRLVAATLTGSPRHPVGHVSATCWCGCPRRTAGTGCGRRAVPGRRRAARRAHRPLRPAQPPRGPPRPARVARHDDAARPRRTVSCAPRPIVGRPARRGSGSC